MRLVRAAGALGYFLLSRVDDVDAVLDVPERPPRPPSDTVDVVVVSLRSLDDTAMFVHPFSSSQNCPSSQGFPDDTQSPS